MNPLFILQNATRKNTAKPAEVEIRNIFSAKANLDATLYFDCAINLLLDDGTAIVPLSFAGVAEVRADAFNPFADEVASALCRAVPL